ncbi:MAG: hypothetical protein ACI4O8_06975 [Aristaeellaceae bacterium]
MKRIKRLFQKDRLGLVRSTLVLGVMLLLIVLLFLFALGSRDSREAEERAADAARQVAQQFQLLVEDGFRQMNVAAEEFSEDTEADRLLLSNMVRYGVFSDAMLLVDGTEYHIDGSSAPAEANRSYIRYRMGGIEGKINSSDDGNVRLCVSANENMEIAAVLDPERLDCILRSAFTESYGYAIFNSATGTYLVNRSDYTDNGYYDTLLKLNSSGSTEQLLRSGIAQARVKHATEAGEYEYIAQTSTSIYPWSIALFIPDALLMQSSEKADSLHLFSAVAVFLLIAALTIYAASILRHLRRENQKEMRKAHVSAKMLELSADDSKATLYLYQRKEDRMLAFYEGLKPEENAQMPAPVSFAELCARYSLSEGDAEQLRERIWDLKDGEQSDLNLICAVQGGKHLLRFVTSCPADEKDLVIGTVRDFTMEQRMKIRFIDERNFHRAILPKTVSVWQVNLSRSRWRITDCKPGLDISKENIRMNEWRDYEADLAMFVRNYVHPKDYEKYISQMGVEEILEMYSKGKTELVMEYRIRGIGNERYQWHRQVVRVFKNPDNNDLLANVYVLNVDAEKDAEIERRERTRILQQTLIALSGMYYGLYYVDLDGDLCYAARTHGGELITRLSTPFKSTFADYITQNVHPDDQETLRRLVDPYVIRKKIREGSHFMRCEYRRSVGDGCYEWSAAIVQAARFENGTVREVVIALRNITNDNQKDRG